MARNGRVIVASSPIATHICGARQKRATSAYPPCACKISAALATPSPRDTSKALRTEMCISKVKEATPKIPTANSKDTQICSRGAGAIIRLLKATHSSRPSTAPARHKVSVRRFCKEESEIAVMESKKQSIQQ